MRWPVARSKYGSTKESVDGYVFDSRHEARRYRDLRLLACAGEVADIEVHPRFDLNVICPDGEVVKIGRYSADFRYTNRLTGRIVIEDAKSGPTRMKEAYRLKKKFVEALYRIEIVEV